MEQLFRDQFAHFIDISKNSSTPNWVLEGIGVEALSIAFNPQTDTFKTIISRTADTTFNSYQLQSSVSGKRIYKGDEIYEFLDEARRKALSIETKLLEVDMAYTTSENKYQAIQYDVLITIDEFLGENATISYNMAIKNPKQGTATIANEKPTFTPSAD